MHNKSAEFIKIMRTIYKRSYGLETNDKLIQMHGKELEGLDLSPEFKTQLWEDMSIDIDELIEEFGEREDISKLSSEFVHEELGISDERDEELRCFAIHLAEKINTIGEFLLDLEASELDLREKLYISAQFGRLHRKEKS